MNNQNFYLRLIALLLIIMAVFFYNGTVKDKEQAQDIADLTAKTESLEKQQDQILTALKETYEEQKTAAESNASSDVSSEADNKSEKDLVLLVLQTLCFGSQICNILGLFFILYCSVIEKYRHDNQQKCDQTQIKVLIIHVVSSPSFYFCRI